MLEQADATRREDAEPAQSGSGSAQLTSPPGAGQTALSHCEIKIVTRLPSRRFQAAATASRHVVIAAVRSTWCV